MRRRALLQTAGAAALTALAGCTDALTDVDPNATQTDDATTTTSPAADSPLTVDDHELVRTGAGSADEVVAVDGTIVNSGDAAVATATVTATFLDDDGESLDHSSADVADLAPGETWSFELVYPGVGEAARAVADYTLDVETGD